MRDVQSRVDRVSWYHDFDFGNGVRARSSHENPDGVRAIWRFIEEQLERIPLEGKSVLDVGAWDGYWSFFAERRGASSVLATDDATQRWANQGGITLARELLDSSIDVREDISAYELSTLGRTFDVILCLGVFYHLWDPLFAFTQLRHCCHSDTILIIEGELAWSGLARGEVRFAQSQWQECVLSPSALEKLLNLAYLRIDEQIWMHPVPTDASDAGPLRADRSLLLCRPFEGINSAYAYRPHFGLQRFDERFRTGEVASKDWRANLQVLAVDALVPAGGEFSATLRVTNTGGDAWRATRIDHTHGSHLLAGHSMRPPRSHLDYRRAFLDKNIVPGEYRNMEPVGHYCRYIEDNALAGRVTLGAQLWDADMRTQIDRDYSRGFLDADLAQNDATTVVVRMRAPQVPGVYAVSFDMVCEYVCWFASSGSTPTVSRITVQ